MQVIKFTFPFRPSLYRFKLINRKMWQRIYVPTWNVRNRDFFTVENIAFSGLMVWTWSFKVWNPQHKERLNFSRVYWFSSLFVGWSEYNWRHQKRLLEKAEMSEVTVLKVSSKDYWSAKDDKGNQIWSRYVFLCTNMTDHYTVFAGAMKWIEELYKSSTWILFLIFLLWFSINSVQPRTIATKLRSLFLIRNSENQ